MNDNLLGLTAQIASAYVGRNDIRTDKVPDLISAIGQSLERLAVGETEPERPIPAVNPSRSVKHAHIVSLIDGKPYKMLKRHIALHGYTPDSYRETFGLRPDYPMTAPAYAEHRRDLAKRIGLGRMPSRRRAARKVS